MSGSLSNLWGLLGPQEPEPAAQTGLLDPNALRNAGQTEGLLRAAAAIAEASRPRLLLQEGRGPGLAGGLANAALGYVQGRREGQRGYMQDQQAQGAINREAALQEAMGNAPDERLSAQGRQMRGVLGGLPPNVRASLSLLDPQQRGEVIARLATRGSNAILSADQVRALGLPDGTIAQQGENGLSIVYRPPEILDPRVQAVRMQLAQAGSPRVNVQLPPMENTFAQGVGRALAEDASGVVTAGTRSANVLRDLQRFERALGEFQTGAGANQMINVGQWAQRLGIPESSLPENLRGRATASAEEMRAITGQLLTGMLGAGGFPAQNFSNADREMLERALPNIANTPQGNRLLIQAARAANERNIEVSRAWRDWSMRNGVSAESYLRFQQERLPQITERDIIAPIVGSAASAGGASPGPGGRGTAEPPRQPQAIGTGGMPRVATPAEAMALPPGTRFVLPDGRIGKVPDRVGR